MGSFLSQDLFHCIGTYCTPQDLIHIEQLSKSFASKSYHYLWWVMCHQAKYIQPALCDEVTHSWKQVYRTLQLLDLIKCHPLDPKDMQNVCTALSSHDQEYKYALVTGEWELDTLNIERVTELENAWNLDIPLPEGFDLSMELRRDTARQIDTPPGYGLTPTMKIRLYIGVTAGDDLYPADIPRDYVEIQMQISYVIPHRFTDIEAILSDGMRRYGMDQVDVNIDTKPSGRLGLLQDAGLITDHVESGKIGVKPLTCLVKYRMTSHVYEHRSVDPSV